MEHTYGTETLTLTKTTAAKLQRTQRAMEQIMLGVRLDKIPNVGHQRENTDTLHRILSMK